MKTEKPNSNPFLAQLFRIVDDRGDRATLRRYWSPTTRHMAYPVLGKLNALKDDRKAIVAALYAEHPLHRASVGVGKGASFLGQRQDGEHPYDRHFRRLLACDEMSDLAQQLHRLVKRLERDKVGIDYDKLYRDLNFWAKYREGVKIEWAADFWQAPLVETAGSKEAAS